MSDKRSPLEEFLNINTTAKPPRAKHKLSAMVYPTEEEHDKGFSAGRGSLKKPTVKNGITKSDIKNNLGSITTDNLRESAGKHLQEPFEDMLFKSLAILHEDFIQGVNIKEYIKMLEMTSKLMVKPVNTSETKVVDEDSKRESLRANLLERLGKQTNESGKIIDKKIAKERAEFIKATLKNRK